MKKLFIALVISALPAISFAGNYASCLLKHLPGLQNDTAAYAARRVCLDEYPGGLDSVAQGEGKGFMSYKSGAECAMKKASNTRSNAAGSGIFAACNKLYNDPGPFDLFK